MYLSNLVTFFDFREVSYFDFVWSHKNSPSSIREEKMNTIYCSISTFWHDFIELDSHKITVSNFRGKTYISNFSSCTILKLASLAYLHGLG